MGRETILASRSQLKPMYMKVVEKGVHFSGDQGQPSLAAMSQMQDAWNEKIQPDSAEPPVGKHQKEKSSTHLMTRLMPVASKMPLKASATLLKISLELVQPKQQQ